MTDATLPYRPNVGIALFNAAGLVFAGTAVNAGPEVVVAGHEWQMPQGGIDADEDIEAAARRELWEETGIADVSVLAVTEEWWPYEFPPYGGRPHKLSAFRGQTQRWAALRFLGDESAIDLTRPPPGCVVEFTTWAWVPLGSLPDRVMPHKRANYREGGGRLRALRRRVRGRRDATGVTRSARRPPGRGAAASAGSAKQDSIAAAPNRNHAPQAR